MQAYRTRTSVLLAVAFVGGMTALPALAQDTSAQSDISWAPPRTYGVTAAFKF